MNQRPREEARFFTFFTCLLLNLGLTFGSIFCPITAFHLPVEEGVLAAVLALVCLLSALLYRYRRAGPVDAGPVGFGFGRGAAPGLGGPGAGDSVCLYPTDVYLSHCL